MDRPCAASCASMFLRTPPAWVSVSPYRSGEPAAASALTIGGVVPLIQIDARFAGMMTLADIGDVALPTNFTAAGTAGCCAPAPVGTSAAAPASSAIATTRDPIESLLSISSPFHYVSSLGRLSRCSYEAVWGAGAEEKTVRNTGIVFSISRTDVAGPDGFSLLPMRISELMS